MARSSVRVLLVDDCLLEARLLQSYLREQFDVAHVLQLQEAQARLRAESFSALLLKTPAPKLSAEFPRLPIVCLPSHELHETGSAASIPKTILDAIHQKQNETRRAPLEGLPVLGLQQKPRGGMIRAGRKIRVLIAEDRSVMRQGLVHLLHGHRDIVVVGEAKDGHEVLALARRVNPHVILLKTSLPRLDEAAAASRLKREFPKIKVIGLPFGETLGRSSPMQRAGALASFDKTKHLDSLVSTIRNCFTGVA
jgi:CheY-like chemotaxis protein